SRAAGRRGSAGAERFGLGTGAETGRTRIKNVAFPPRKIRGTRSVWRRSPFSWVLGEGAMNSEHARLKAAEYAARADDAFDDETRNLFLQMQEMWIRLAQSLEFDGDDQWPNGLAA